MPLVRIDIIEGRTDAEIKTLTDTVQDCIVETFDVPETDRYQIVTEHKKGRMVLLDTGLGFERTDQVVAIQIFTSPRATRSKTDFYKLVTDKLGSVCGVAPTDVFISVMTNTDVDWSFGNGEAQYLTGTL